MKLLIYFLTFLAAINSNTGQNKAKNLKSFENPSLSADDQSGIIVGPIHKEDLMQAPYASWFEPLYKSYQPEKKTLKKIKKNIKDYDVKVFMGTWCGDSKREVPKFLKILELSNYNMEHLDIEGVTRRKTLPGDLQKTYDIHHVPTIIFYKDGKEVNRFVEYPQESFEKDIEAIVTGEDYKDSYKN